LSLRQQLLDELHDGHLGIVRMKHVARSFIWWPGIDGDIENTAKQCTPCCQTRHMPPTTVHPWQRPPGPWQRIHADFLGPVHNCMFLIVVDAYSKWPEVQCMRNTTASETIEAFRKLFSTWGLPLQLHTDNGPQFVSAEFEHFVKANGVKHTTSPIYHPPSNGQAERFVATFKRALNAMKPDDCSLQTKISRFLLTYRPTVNTSTGETPSSLMLGRRIRTRLDLIKPVPKNYEIKRKQQYRTFSVGQPVFVRDYRANTKKWISGVIHEKLGNFVYNISVYTPYGHAIWKRHADQIISRQEEEEHPQDQPVRRTEHCHMQPADDILDQQLPISLPTVSIPRPDVTAAPSSADNQRGLTQCTSTSTTDQPAPCRDLNGTTDSDTKYSSRGRKLTPSTKLRDFVI